MAFENLNVRNILWPGLKWILPEERPEKPWFASSVVQLSLQEKSVPDALENPCLSSGQKKIYRQTPSTHPVIHPSVPQDSWPEHWRKRFVATRRGSIVWTYWELGQDICNTPDIARRKVLQRLIADLAYRPGTHTFFPVCLPEEAEQSISSVFMPNPEIFWSALELLGTRAVLILGDEATQALNLAKDLPLWGMLRQRGFFVWRLPRVEVVGKDEKAYSTLFEFLRTGLRDVARGVP